MNQEFDISNYIEAKTLNKPFRTPKGPKKFSVYVKNEKGNIVKVNFGDPNMEIKRDDPNRRKNFRSRHNCENPGPKTKARYWSCKMWESKKSVTDYTSGSEWDGETLWDETKLLLSNPSLANAEEIMEEYEECEECEEVEEANEEEDYEASMMVSQLTKIAHQSSSMILKLKTMEGENIEAWVQDKVSKAEHFIEAAFDYMMYSSEARGARPGPKSSAQTPAKPEEKKKGSSKNPPGSAGTKPDAKKIAQENLEKKDEKSKVKMIESDSEAIQFSAQVTESLKNKVKEHNQKYPSKKVTLSQLKKVYRRGAGAFSSSHRPGKTRGQWAMARVNMFLKMKRGGSVKDAYRKADQDIANATEFDVVEMIPSEQDLAEAKAELEQAGLFDLDFDNSDQLFLDDSSEKSALGFILDRYI